MSHQDRKSPQQIVVNHESLREVVSWLLKPSLFVGMPVRQESTWKPRMLAAAALFWATSDRTTLTGRFEHARKIIKKIFHWQPEPGHTYRGFMKMLDKWDVRLLSVVCELRVWMEQELPEQFQIAGFTIFAADGSRCKCCCGHLLCCRSSSAAEACYDEALDDYDDCIATCGS